MGEKFRVREYVRQLKQLNNYLPMLPVEDGTPAVKLTEAQLARDRGARPPQNVGMSTYWCTILTSTTRRWTRLSLTSNALRPWTISDAQRRTTTHLRTLRPRKPRRALGVTRGPNVKRTANLAENGACFAKQAPTTQRIAGPRIRPVATTKRGNKRVNFRGFQKWLQQSGEQFDVLQRAISRHLPVDCKLCRSGKQQETQS